MEAILKFNLPDDQEDFNIALDGGKWALSMWELNNWLRSQIKHPPEGMSDDTYKAFEDARDQLYEILNENQLRLLKYLYD
jgi:hypothetical protein